MTDSNDQNSRALLEVIKTNNLKKLRLFFINRPELNEETISTALDESKSFKVSKWLIKEQKPNPLSVEKVLIKAAGNYQHHLVHLILTLNNASKPSDSAVEKALFAAVAKGDLKTTQIFFSIKSYKFSQKTISTALDRSGKWEVAQWLIGTQDLNSSSVESLLIKAASKNRYKLVHSILQLNNTSKPSNSAVENALFAAIDKPDLKMTQIFFSTKPCQFSPATISTALGKSNARISKWLIDTQNPDKNAIQSFLLRAIVSNNLHLVKYIFQRFNFEAEFISSAKRQATDTTLISYLEQKLKQEQFINIISFLYLGFFDENSSLSRLPFELIIEIMKSATDSLCPNNTEKVDSAILRLNSIRKSYGNYPLFSENVSSRHDEPLAQVRMNMV